MSCPRNPDFQFPLSHPSDNPWTNPLKRLSPRCTNLLSQQLRLHTCTYSHLCSHLSDLSVLLQPPSGWRQGSPHGRFQRAMHHRYEVYPNCYSLSTKGEPECFLTLIVALAKGIANPASSGYLTSLVTRAVELDSEEPVVCVESEEQYVSTSPPSPSPCFPTFLTLHFLPTAQFLLGSRTK